MPDLNLADSSNIVNSPLQTDYIMMMRGSSFQKIEFQKFSDVIPFEAVGVNSTNSAAQNKIALQAAIDDFSDNTGGTKVLFGTTHYPLSGPIILRPGVYLQGNSHLGMKGDPYTARFVITDNVNNLFKMQGRCGIEGFIFDYPNNNLQTTSPGSFTVYPTAIVLDTAVNAPQQITIKNCTFVGGSAFIDFAAIHQDLHLEKLYGYPLHGPMIKLYRCWDIPYIDVVHVNPGAGLGYRASHGSTGTPCSPQVIDYVIDNAAPTFDITETDEFVFQRLFAFGVKTAFKIVSSYGSFTQCNADIVETIFDLNINEDRKAVQIVGCSGIPSGGSNPGNRNAIKFGGVGGTVLIHGLNIQLGVNGAVPSSNNPNANAVLVVNGSGNQRVQLHGMTCYSSGTFTNDVIRSNGSANVKYYGMEILNATNKITQS